MEKRRKEAAAAAAAWASVPSDLILEILARVPYRSLCRFKCMSRAWQPGDRGDLAAPPNQVMKQLNITRLCFHPAAVTPRRFTVFVFMHSFTRIVRVEVYSSETGRCISLQSRWIPKTLVLGDDSRCVFFNGALHFATCHSAVTLDRDRKLIRWIVTVDTDGKTLRRIQLPHNIDSSGFIGLSQGRLCAACIGHENLSVWVLEDYASGLWTLKHTATILELL